MNGDELSSDVADFMRNLFRHHLAVATLHPNPPDAPNLPAEWSQDLIDACQGAVRILIVAFINIKYVSWDFAKYCEDCKNSGLGCGGNVEREQEILHRWPPKYCPTVSVNSARVFADPYGRIIAWILPSIIPSHYQDILHHAVKVLEPSLVKKFHRPAEGGSWRSNAMFFAPDNNFVSSGQINLSAAWFMAGHNGPVHTTPFLQRREGQEFLSIVQNPFAVMTGILAIVHPKQYDMAKEMKESIMMSGQCEKPLEQWPTVFTAISVITNRESPFHRDLQESWEWFDFLLSFGRYEHAPLYLANLGIRVNNPPGTICAFGGRALWHGVRKVMPRITFAFYMRKNILKELDIESAGWMTQREHEEYIGVQRHNLRRYRPKTFHPSNVEKSSL